MGEIPVLGQAVGRERKISTVHLSLNPANQPRSCSELLAELSIPSHFETHSLEFKITSGDIGRDVYNITAPFEWNGKTLLIGRVESRDSELSEIVIFEQSGTNQWTSYFTHPEFRGLQDPCVTWAGNGMILGGVRYPVPLKSGADSWMMDFYRGESVESLRHFLSGPPGMKDIRFKELPNGTVAIFSRPQGDIGGRGQIGFTIAPSWDEITTEMIAAAPLFDRQLRKDEWCGANEVHLLENGHLGILGHIACFDAKHNRHYYPMAFSVDPLTHAPSPIRIIAQRSFFPPGASKRPDLADVVFSGGIVRNGNGTVNLFAGTSDAAAAVIVLPDPFLALER